jgi:hypothetical protein
MSTEEKVEEFAPDSRTIYNGQIWELRSAYKTEVFIVAQTDNRTFRLISLETFNRWSDNACFSETGEGESWHYIGIMYPRGFHNNITHKLEVVKL